MNIELRNLSSFGDREHDQLAKLRAEIDFEIPPKIWTLAEDTPWRVLVWEEDRLIGHVGVLSREIAVGGQPLVVAGIRSVMTLPAARGRGVASSAMTRAAQFIADDLVDVEHGLLLCLDKRVALYGRLGWTVASDPTTFEQPDGPTRCAINTMVRPFRGNPWPAGPIDLRGLPW